MLLRGPSEKVLNQSIYRMKEQKTRLWCLASEMPKSVMPSAAIKRKVFKEKKRKNLAVLLKRRNWNIFFQQSF